MMAELFPMELGNHQLELYALPIDLHVNISSGAAAPVPVPTLSLSTPPIQAMDSRTDTPAMPCAIAHIPISHVPQYHSNAQQAYVSLELPISLCNIVPNDTFRERMELLNAGLSRFWTLRDFGPIQRLVVLITFITFCFSFILSSGGSSGIQATFVGTAIIVGLLVASMVFGCTFWKRKYVAFVEVQMRNFTDQDKHLNLKWECRYNTEQVKTFMIDWKAHHIPWSIVVWKLNYRPAVEPAAVQDEECLPRYAASADYPESTTTCPESTVAESEYNGDFLVAADENLDTFDLELQELGSAPTYKSEGWGRDGRLTSLNLGLMMMLSGI
ncbi:hypothetical protein HK100_005959 [Physocladia obscura]|uniref:Uncharacterized protein n=1 Tax=Physocladia obscura TaxID=109957 RepID=A0AAD5T851_9FUNG|nr:hypothetical protein HK100_005959 [Physocladia obscura]